MDKYDVVVIGAGNGGMTSALGLALKGARVLLLERHNIPGGAATSFVRGRFEFEVALHQLASLGTEQRPGHLRKLLTEYGVIDNLDFHCAKHLYRSVIPGSLDITLPHTREGIVCTLQQTFPREKDSIARFIDLCFNFCEESNEGFTVNAPDCTPTKYPLFFKYSLRSSKEVLDEFFSDELLKTTLASFWSYVGVPPSGMGFSDLAGIIWEYVVYKPFHIRGGSQTLSNALIDRFISVGGEVRFNCGVSRILLDNNRAVAVVTDQGQEICAQAIISNVSSIVTYVDMIGADQLPKGVLDSFRGRQPGISGFMIWTGLDCEPADLGIEVGTTFIHSDTDMERAWRATKTLDPPLSIDVTCHDAVDPGFTGEGICQVVVGAVVYGQPWEAVPPADYADKKFEWAKSMIDRADQLYPGFKDSIEEMEIASPLTFQRYMGHPGGAIYGFDQFIKDGTWFCGDTSQLSEHDLHDLPVDRVLRASSNRTPINGLYFAGSWAGMGGFSTVLRNGATAAETVYSDLGRSL